MLHILLLILKIIGIVLAVILGIILLLVCIILFVPVCYRAEGESKGSLESLKLHGQVSWLFGLVKVIADLNGKEPDYYIKIAWKRFGEQEMQDICGSGKEDAYELDQEVFSEDKTAEEEIKKKNEVDTVSKVLPEDVDGHRESEKVPKKESTVSKSVAKHEDEKTSKENKIEKIVQKIKRIAGNIKCTIKRFCDKIKEISEKKERITDFVTDETHLHALSKTKEELLKLLKRMKPGLIRADVRFGFTDPGLTGRVLAILGAFYPFLGEDVEVTPDFQEAVLEGSLRIKGRIYVVHLVLLAINLVLSKDVRRTFKDVKTFEL